MTLGADAFDSDGRVDLESEVKRRGASRKLDDVSLRGEHEYLVGEQVDLQGLHELFRVVEVFLPFQRLSQPSELSLFLVFRYAFLVFPVGRDTVFRDPVHFIGSDLDLKRFPVVSDHRSMQRLVSVWFRHRYVILETSRDRFPHSVNDTEDPRNSPSQCPR